MSDCDWFGMLEKLKRPFEICRHAFSGGETHPGITAFDIVARLVECFLEYGDGRFDIVELVQKLALQASQPMLNRSFVGSCQAAIGQAQGPFEPILRSLVARRLQIGGCRARVASVVEVFGM